MEQEKMKVTIIQYQKIYKNLNKKLYETNRKMYDQSLIVLRLIALENNCAYMVKAGKPQKNGTKVTFSVAETAEQYQEEIQKLTEDAKKNGFTVKEEEEDEGNAY